MKKKKLFYRGIIVAVLIFTLFVNSIPMAMLKVDAAELVSIESDIQEENDADTEETQEEPDKEKTSLIIAFEQLDNERIEIKEKLPVQEIIEMLPKVLTAYLQGEEVGLALAKIMPLALLNAIACSS